MRKFISLILIHLVLCRCSTPEKKTIFYPNGQIKFEVPIKNGRMHGLARGYYETGELRGEVEYINDKEEGLWYDLDKKGRFLERKIYRNGVIVEHEVYNSGILFGKTFYDSLGHPQDFRQYKTNGERDMSVVHPVFYTIPDTVKLGIKTTLFVRLGNVDSNKLNKGYLLIASGFDSTKSNKPLDTLQNIYSSNENGFRYEFTPSRKGNSQIFGWLRFVDSNNSVVYGPRPFVYKFVVW